MKSNPLTKQTEVRHVLGHLGKVKLILPGYVGIWWYDALWGNEHTLPVRLHGLPTFWQKNSIQTHENYINEITEIQKKQKRICDYGNCRTLANKKYKSYWLCEYHNDLCINKSNLI